MTNDEERERLNREKITSSISPAYFARVCKHTRPHSYWTKSLSFEAGFYQKYLSRWKKSTQAS